MSLGGCRLLHNSSLVRPCGNGPCDLCFVLRTSNEKSEAGQANNKIPIFVRKCYKQPMFRLGYNTNGFKSHPLLVTIAILADIGYRSVAITLDHNALNPWAPDIDVQLATVKQLLDRKKMCSVIETGAGFLLDPWKKHRPTLISRSPQGREQRLNFLKKAVDIAAVVEAETVSFWAGRPEEGLDLNQARGWLVESCKALCEYAERYDVALALEPEPGMLVESLSDFDQLTSNVDHPRLGLALDIGHAHLTESCPLAETIQRYSEKIRTLHIEDMRRPVHEHLMFGEGEINFWAVLEALNACGYTGSICVELSRHSHDAVNAAKTSFEFLRTVDQAHRNVQP
jgi:L-ribulose-5-phosphate 3-epimerase